MASKSVLAWHFVNGSLRDGRSVPADGVELIHTGQVEMCRSGLHASVRLIDALEFAPGSTICRVRMGDVVQQDADKLVARSRTILWRVDGEPVLREFARDCALDVLHLWATPAIPNIDVVVEYLLTGDELLRERCMARRTGRCTGRRTGRRMGRPKRAAGNARRSGQKVEALDGY
jgi:hypothetical protein